MPGSLSIGFVAFQGLTHLDLAGPHEVLSRLSAARLHVIAKTSEPVVSESGLAVHPSCTLSSAPPLDVICVPGGRGIDSLFADEEVLDFLVARAPDARFVTAVCTGSLLLGAAGLLQGYRATTHWMSLGLLALFGAVAVESRVVIDRNRITGGGVTAGIDFGLGLVAVLEGEERAREIQLMLEYDPAPPFASGSPRTAHADTVARVVASRAERQTARARLAEAAAKKMSSRGAR